MSKAIALALLAAFALSLPFVHVCISSVSEEAITALDVCSPKAPGTTADTASLIEPVYSVRSEMPVSYLPAENFTIMESRFFSPIDRPPVS